MISIIMAIAFAYAEPTIGVIDQIEDDIAVVELTSTDSGSVTMELPIIVFPCDVREGDWFYFEHIDGVTELRCGEPPV